MASATMALTDNGFHFLDNPTPDKIAPTVQEFLNQLTTPTHVKISGRDSSRCRVLATLIHGNEPSGFYALYKFLQDQIQPAVDLHILLPSITVAKATPEFSHRMLPNHRDLNRCFRPPYTDQVESLLAQQILLILTTLQPEAVIDLHNTSGSGPAFGVATHIGAEHKALVSYFTDKMVITDLHLGALMEAELSSGPIITIECGGAKDHESHILAYHGLLNFAQAEEVLTPMPHSPGIEIFHHPIRVELQPNTSLDYDDDWVEDRDLTLVNHIEDFNFGIVDEHTTLGFIKAGDLNKLSAKNSQGLELIDHYFQIVNDQLRPRQQLKLFMITTNAEIARNDCLFYFVSLGN